MAVFTTLDLDEISDIIKPYGIGELVSFSGVSDGLENTNYAITTSSNHLAEEYGHEQQGDYFLTLFEELPENDLPFHLSLLECLHRNHIPVSSPIRDYDGKAIQIIAGKPAVICPRLKGQHPRVPTLKQVAILGETLAQIHHAARDMPYEQGGIRDTAWLEQTLQTVENQLSDSERQQCHEVMTQYLQIITDKDLPKTIIHGDLFRDNALFEGETLTGVIDFFSAGRGHALYDLAVSCNDWCIVDNRIDTEKLQALLQGYASVRAFTAAEKKHWPVFVKVTAMRFWLSRLLAHQRIMSHPGELNTFKSPEPFRALFLEYAKQGVVDLTSFDPYG